MGLKIPFLFRKKSYTCTVFIDISDDPCFIFILLNDVGLVKEFGEDVTIKTDCVQILAKADDYAELVELRQAIFDIVKGTPEFMVVKRKRLRWDELQKPFLKNKLPSWIK